VPDKPVHDGWTLRTDKRNTVKRKQHFRAVTKTAHKAFTSTNLQTSMQSTKIEWYLLNYWTSMYSRIHRAIETKNSPVRDWRSTPTYCQLQSHLTQKLGQKIKNPWSFAGPHDKRGGESLWNWPNFLTWMALTAVLTCYCAGTLDCYSRLTPCQSIALMN